MVLFSFKIIFLTLQILANLKAKKIKNETYHFFPGTPFSSDVTRRSATPTAVACTSSMAIRFATPEFKESSLSSGKSDQSTTSEIGTNSLL